MKNELSKLQPVPILVTSYNRINYLKKTIERINSTTLYPFYLFVVDNHSTDGSVEYLKAAKVRGKLFDFIEMEENVGQSRALNALIERVKYWQNRRRPMADWIVFTNEDILPPHLRPDCWLERMINIFEKHEKYDGLGALAMRIQRMARADIDEKKDIIYWNKGIPSVFRLMRFSDIEKLGDKPMGELLKWNGNSVAIKLQIQLKKKFGFATHIYADHIGFAENKGYDKDTETLTVAANKVTEHLDKPYPDIDPETNVPVKINHPCDTAEQHMRENYYKWLNGEKTDEDPDITIIVLTCNRLDGLIRTIESVKKNTKDVKYEILVVADKNDVVAYNYCLEKNIKCILSNFHRDFVAQANLGIYACDTRYFCKVDDDMEIIEPDWLSRGLKIFKEKFLDENGLLCFNDGICHGAVYTVGISTKKFVNKLRGHLYFPKYKHYAGDRELVGMVRQLGCYHYEPTIKVNHYHPTQKDSTLIVNKDETYETSENSYLRRDQRIKRERQRDPDLIPNKLNHYDW